MNSPIYWLMFGCIVMTSIGASGCGHIDQDFDLSDQEIETRYGFGSGQISGSGVGYAHSSGCGGVGYGYAQRGYARSLSDAQVSVNTAGDAALDSQNAQMTSGDLYFVTRRDTSKDEPRKDDPALPKGRTLRTWGDYLAQEMARAQRLNSP